MFVDDFALEIVRLFTANLKRIMSISEIAQETGKKYPFVHRKVMDLQTLGVLAPVVLGRAHLVRLDMGHPMAQLCLGIAYERMAPDWSHDFMGFLRRIYRGSTRTVVYDGLATVYVASHPADILDQQSLASLQVFFAQDDKRKEVRVVALDIPSLVRMLLDDEKLFAEHCVLHNTELFLESVVLEEMAFEQRYGPLSRGGGGA